MNARHHVTIAEASRRIASRDLSPLELTQTYLDRIAAVDDQLHAFVLVTGEAALNEARKAGAEIAAGNARGPLQGIPIGIKDIYGTAGVRTTCHSRLLVDHVPSEDAESIRRLKAAGAIVLGKLATHEFAFGGPSHDLPFPAARNPWNIDHVPGGSSSGSGAAVAAGLCAGATGSDTGGSIRNPAGNCGIAGIKPTYGLVSRRGVFPLAHTLDTCGPMAWTSEDCALLLQGMAGFDPRDPACVDVALPDYHAEAMKPVRGLRVGVVRHFYEGRDGATPETQRLIADALEVVSDLGIVIRDVTLPELYDFHAAGRVIVLGEAYAVHRAHLAKTPELYGQYSRERLRLGALLTAEEYYQGQRYRRVLTERTLSAMEGVDLLVTANNYGAAERFSDARVFPYFGKPYLSMPFNLTGQPALAVCCGFGTDGLPHSMQIVGRAFDDATVLRLGHAYEQATAWRQCRPAI
ncbi:MAG TPA: amidase [Stellaceae bacterium]|nr:amidase [Stellaceae bacterium]